MSKVILVIDEPQGCIGCPVEVAKYCQAAKKEITGYNILSKRQDWCPLKPVPEKLEVGNQWFSRGYTEGYNALIDEILNGGDRNG